MNNAVRLVNPTTFDCFTLVCQQIVGNDYCAGLNQQLYMKQYCGSKTIVDFSF